MGFLKDLYYDRISLWGENVPKDSKYAQLQTKVIEKECALNEKIDSSPELKNLFREYQEAEDELSSQGDYETFVDTFRLASRMFIDIFFQQGG